jgi:hypothetical protein
MHYRRNEIKYILQALKEHDTGESTCSRSPVVRGSVSMEGLKLHLKSLKKRKKSFIDQSEQLGWLMMKLEYFTPIAWWIHPALLVLRLVQSSALALFRKQHMLAACSSCIALAGVCLIRETLPFRRLSE